MNQELGAILGLLIGTRSYTGEEQAIVEVIRTLMVERGFDEVFIDEAGNIVGGIHGTQPGKTILFDGHIDTVEAGNIQEWTRSPFEAWEKDGLLHGRGTSDMKGAFGSMLLALSRLDRSRLQGKVYLSGTVNEEVAEGYTIREVTHRLKPDLVVIGEATELRLNIGQRGRGEIVLKVFGKSAHSSNPSIGINAVLKMNEAITAITKEYVAKEDVLGAGILVLTDILSDPYPGESVIPRLCTATFDKRVLLSETKEGILEDIAKILDGIKEKDREFRYELSYAINEITTYAGMDIKGDKFYPPWRLDETDPLVGRIRLALQEVGLEASLSSYSFCTNGSSTCGIDEIPTIGFGPGREQEAHITNEFISINSLEQAVRGYEALAYIFS